MTFQELGGLGEFVGGVGIIVSLVYLAIQIKQSSRIERLNAGHAINQSISEMIETLDRDPELRRIWQIVREGSVDLTDDERERLGRYLFRSFSTLSVADSFAELDPSLGRRYKPVLLAILRDAAVQDWWSRLRLAYPDPFRSTVDTHLRRIVAEQGLPSEETRIS